MHVDGLTRPDAQQHGLTRFRAARAVRPMHVDCMLKLLASLSCALCMPWEQSGVMLTLCLFLSFIFAACVIVLLYWLAGWRGLHVPARTFDAQDSTFRLPVTATCTVPFKHKRLRL